MSGGCAKGLERLSVLDAIMQIGYTHRHIQACPLFLFHGTYGIAYGAPGGPDQECDCEGSMVEGSELSLSDRTLMASLHFDST